MAATWDLWNVKYLLWRETAEWVLYWSLLQLRMCCSVGILVYPNPASDIVSLIPKWMRNVSEIHNNNSWDTQSFFLIVWFMTIVIPAISWLLTYSPDIHHGLGVLRCVWHHYLSILSQSARVRTICVWFDSLFLLQGFAMIFSLARRMQELIILLIRDLPILGIDTVWRDLVGSNSYIMSITKL